MADIIKKPLITILFFMLLQPVVLLADSPAILRVGFAIQEPFTIEKEGKYTGLSIDLWKQIADSLNYKYELRKYEEKEMLDLLKNGDLDVAISPLTVTPSRIKEFHFTQPYYITNLAFASTAHKGSALVEFLKDVFSVNFFKALAPLVIIVFMFGAVVWVLERKRNRQQFRKGSKGLIDGVWWSATTMTTVGYGDKAPITIGGRILGVIWMFTAVIVISSLTASIASSLTISKLKADVKSFDDLRNVKTGSVSGSGTADLLKQYDIDFKSFNNVGDGLQDLENDEITAFVYDETNLKYNMGEKHYKKDIQIVPSVYFKEYFSIAGNNPKLIRQIDIELVKVIESYDWESYLRKYDLK